MTFEVTFEEVLADPCASNWLKQAIRDLQKRDPVDALNDVSFLVTLLHKHLPSGPTSTS